MRKTVFIVDGNDTSLSTARDALYEHYEVITFPSASKMFTQIDKVKPDLILLDIDIPEMDGFQALKLLKENNNYSDIPVIFVTSMTDSDIEVRSFKMGVVDFVAKPYSEPILLNRIKTHLNIDELIRERTVQLQRKTAQLQNLQNVIVFFLADIAENRSQIEGGHIDRTTLYVRTIIDAMLERNIYDELLRGRDIDMIVSSARLHDVGKISISDAILNKPGKLTDREFEIMKTHCVEGVRIIDQIVSRTEDVEFLRSAKLFAGYHHERWDGKGYPYGLKKTDIPLLGRIMSIVDVYDALVSKRPYKKAFSPEEAVIIIMDCAGQQFDPVIADVFYEVRKEFEEIALQGGNTPQGR